MATEKENARDEVLKRMLKTPPKPFTPKSKDKSNTDDVKKDAEELLEDLDKGPMGA